MTYGHLSRTSPCLGILSALSSICGPPNGPLFETFDEWICEVSVTKILMNGVSSLQQSVTL